MSDIMEETAVSKNELRKQIKEFRKKLFSQNPEYRAVESKRICESIIKSQNFAQSDLILGFMSLFDEVDVLLLLNAAVAQNKLIAVPRIVPDTCLMDFYYVDYSKLNGGMETGSYGIFEPNEKSEKFEISSLKEKLCQTGKNESINVLVLVPGLGFTKDGKRIGRGKGFYDRYLSVLEKRCNQLEQSENHQIKIKKTGICFPFQIMETIPVDKNDCLVDQVIF